MWADRAVWLCLVGFLTAELMAQAALSFNGSNYLQPPPFLVPTDSPHPSSLTVVYGISVFLFQWLLWSAWDSISSSSIFPFLGRGALCCPRNNQVSIKFYYTKQIDHSVLINILCVFFNQLTPPPLPRWPKNQLCSKGVCGARTSSLLVTSYAQLGNFNPLVLHQCPDGVYFGLTHKQSSLVKHRHHFSV